MKVTHNVTGLILKIPLVFTKWDISVGRVLTTLGGPF